MRNCNDKVPSTRDGNDEVWKTKVSGGSNESGTADDNDASNACERSHVASSSCNSSTQGADINTTTEVRDTTGVVRDEEDIAPARSGFRKTAGLGAIQIQVRCLRSVVLPDGVVKVKAGDTRAMSSSSLNDVFRMGLTANLIIIG